MNAKPAEDRASARLTFLMTEAQRARIDAWRRDQPDLPNRAEAARRLIDAGLDAESKPSVEG